MSSPAQTRRFGDEVYASVAETLRTMRLQMAGFAPALRDFQRLGPRNPDTETVHFVIRRP